MMDERRISYAEELKAGRPVFIAMTHGVSMQPLLYEGKTQVVVSPLSRPLRVGDVPFYRIPTGQYVLHRVVKIRDGVCYTRGDNCYAPEAIEPEWVFGIMTSVIRNGKTIQVTDFGYRCYSVFWLVNYPVRAVLNRFPVRKWPYYITHFPTLLYQKLTHNRSTR